MTEQVAGPSAADARRNLVEQAAHVGSWEWDIRSGIVLWSDELFRLYGLRPGEVVPSFEEFLARVDPEDRPNVQSTVERALSDARPFWFTHRLRRPDGDIRLLRCSGSVSVDGSGAPVQMAGTAQDMSREAKAEEALATETGWVKLLGDVAVASNEASSVEEAMQTALNLICHSQQWPIGHVCMADRSGRVVPTSIWHLADPDRFREFREASEKMEFLSGAGLPGRVVSSGKAAWIEDVQRDHDFPRADAAALSGIRTGVAVPVMVGRDVGAVLEFFSERRQVSSPQLLDLLSKVGAQLGRVLERDRGLSALREAEGKIRAVVDSASDAFVSTDSLGTVTDWNSSAAELFGWSREEILGLSLGSTIVPHAYREAHRAGMERFIRTGEARVLGQRLELSALNKAGHEFPVEFSIWAVRHDDGYRFHSFIRDISQRKRAEREALSAFEREQQMVVELRELDKTKSDFVSSISHELRTPLTSIIGYLALVAEDPELPSQLAEHLHTVKRNAKRLQSLIEDILTISRIEHGGTELNVEPVRVEGLVESALSVLRPSLEGRDLSVDVEVDPDVGKVLADPGQVERVLLNLLGNAVKFTPDGGSIKVEVRQGASEASVTVADTGVGVPVDEQPNLFGRFFRSSTSQKMAIGGTGLGLAISKEIIQRHGGTISLQSTPGEGTTVCFTLPQPRESVQQTQAQGTAAAQGD
ncbi:MAG TPA: ATP-binding protein [Actinomycetota bacterium]|nr:ATP-binding protein [Actinomycetota bacterium]